MGLLINKSFIIKKSMFVVAGLFSIIAVSLNGAALGTDYWIVSSGTLKGDSIPTLKVNYGFFKGEKQIDLLGVSLWTLHVYCGSGGSCMLSCGADANEWKQDFEYFKDGTGRPVTCKSKKTAKELGLSSYSGRVADAVEFLGNGFRISTIIFLVLALLFQLVSSGLCAANIFTVPIEWWVGPLGIYIANSASVFVNMIALAIWGSHYDSKLSTHLSVAETLSNSYQIDSSSLGFSYWLSFAAMIIIALTCIPIYFRDSLKKFADKEMPAEQAVAPSGVILLY